MKVFVILKINKNYNISKQENGKDFLKYNKTC